MNFDEEFITINDTCYLLLQNNFSLSQIVFISTFEKIE